MCDKLGNSSTCAIYTLISVRERKIYGVTGHKICIF